MGYSPCIVADFGHFQTAVIFGILGVFLERFSDIRCFLERFFAQNNFNWVVEPFFALFWYF